MKPVSLYRWCKLEGQSGWRLVTVEYNSLSTEMSLLDVVTCDCKAFYIHYGSFFFSTQELDSFSFFNSSMTPFPFHLISSWEHLQKSSESTPWVDFSSGSGPSPTSQGFLFTSLRSANTTRSNLLSACSMESFMFLSWPYDWFVSLLFMDLCRQMCRIIKTTGKDELFLLKVSYVSVHGTRLVK